jgi:hypothetical protein
LPIVTLFTVPKPWTGHVGVIQHNAVGSWKELGDQVEVILCGDEDGVGSAAARLGVRHVPDVERNEYGTPLLDSAFRAARDASQSPLLAYANADIILFRDFLDAAARLPPTHLMCGARWNVDLEEQLDFDRPWESHVRRLIETNGFRAPPFYIDYFVFSRDSPLVDLPRFAVGRPRWDNWMIFRARTLGIPVVDATRYVDAVHQSHDYSHIPNGSGELWYGPEADANAALAGKTPLMSLHHATHVLTPRGVRPAAARRYLRARWETRHAVNGAVERLARAVSAVRRRRPARRGTFGPG